MLSADYGVIGGTGVYDPDLLENPVEHTLETRYGKSSCVIGDYKGKRIAFMPRHGKNHSVPPHQVNYKANIEGLYQLGVRQVLATAAVGSLRLSLPPGSLSIVDQFLDFTKARSSTFFENGLPVAHVDMTDPYCRRLRAKLAETAEKAGIYAANGGTYVCAEGPRFETPAEIRAFAQLGGDVVGMTSVPETVLAKERGLCYATVAMITNYAAGISKTPLSHQEVVDEMARNVHRVRELFFDTLTALDSHRDCACKDAAGGVSLD